MNGQIKILLWEEIREGLRADAVGKGFAGIGPHGPHNFLAFVVAQIFRKMLLLCSPRAFGRWQ
jgi:hypothetical protein